MAKRKGKPDLEDVAEKTRRKRAKQEAALVEGITKGLGHLVSLYREVPVEPWTMVVISWALSVQAILQSADRESPFEKRRYLPRPALKP
jgi:hypothetical protein